MAGIRKRFWDGIEELGNFYKELANEVAECNKFNLNKKGVEDIYTFTQKRSDMYGQFGCLCIDRVYDHNVFKLVKDTVKFTIKEIKIDNKIKKAVKEANKKGIPVLVTKVY